MPAVQPLGPAAAAGQVPGLVLGRVTDNADPESRGRIQVELQGTGLVTWAPVLVASAGSGYGISLLPRVDEIVLLGFVGPDEPVVLGALWTGRAQPPDDATPVDRRYLVRSPAGTQWLIDDDGPSLQLQTPAGNRLSVTDAGGGQATLELGGERIELTPGRVRVTSSGTVEVQASQVEVSAGMVRVSAGMSQFSGVVQCDTLITNAVVSSSYTPGAGNIW
jgi:uncharacterized protein involved in type VI secretion and phage assembly